MTYGQMNLITKMTIYAVPGSRKLVAENNLTFNHHFYCHFGKQIMKSEQPANGTY